MAESLEQHYCRLLGLEEPWVVATVDLDLAAQRVEIRLGAQVDTRGLKCPECGKWTALYDHAPERRWRHLDTMQFETVLIARIPRVNCPQHGVKTIEVPWAGKNSRFTLMFEAFAFGSYRHARRSKVARGSCGWIGTVHIKSWSEPWNEACSVA